ncbi:hypothetical protein [Flagellimonas pacifica]|uniref:DUF1311 domain-containing protein n=1 Tax=Flagellimonas pacifica TaxID=1247520 RepID=A0A285MWQ0_9FLAO|nr:hypothetical protein [Allomuricauda parva]SNZ01615.1 hypothetical protein SAMN06265377_3457 [Allomuricauda parva]
MKKVVLPLCFIVMVSVGLLSMDAFPEKVDFSKMFKFEKKEVSDHPIKYSDCISEAELSKLDSIGANFNSLPKGTLFKEINICLEKYQLSLDSTIENLSAIDAHEFLHNEYERCKTIIYKESISEIKTYYHKGIMQICYERDKSLNQTSNKVAKL